MRKSETGERDTMRVLYIAIFFIAGISLSAARDTEVPWPEWYAKTRTNLEAKSGLTSQILAIRPRACGVEEKPETFDAECAEFYDSLILTMTGLEHLLQAMIATEGWPAAKRDRVISVANPVYQQVDAESDKLWQMIRKEYPPRSSSNSKK